MRKKDRFVYVPTIKSNGCLYDGSPLVHKKTYKLMGDEGVKELDDFIKQIVETRKKAISMVIESAYGLKNFVSVFDFKHKILLHIDDGIPHHSERKDYVGEPMYNSYHFSHEDFKSDKEFENLVTNYLYDPDSSLFGLSEAERKPFKKK